MTKNHKLKLIAAFQGSQAIELASNWDGGITEAINTLDIGEWMLWDIEDTSMRTFHSIAEEQGKEIATLKHPILHARYILRVK